MPEDNFLAMLVAMKFSPLAEKATFIKGGDAAVQLSARLILTTERRVSCQTSKISLIGTLAFLAIALFYVTPCARMLFVMEEIGVTSTTASGLASVTVAGMLASLNFQRISKCRKPQTFAIGGLVTH